MQTFMQFGADEAQPLPELRSPDAVGRRRRELSLRILVGDILQDGRILGQHGSVVEPQRRHVAQRIDGAIVLAGRRNLSGVGVDLDEVDRGAGLIEGDASRHRAGERGEIELHGNCLFPVVIFVLSRI